MTMSAVLRSEQDKEARGEGRVWGREGGKEGGRGGSFCKCVYTLERKTKSSN